MISQLNKYKNYKTAKQLLFGHYNWYMWSSPQS